MNPTLRFAILAAFIFGGMILVAVMFGRPTTFTSWLLIVALGASLVMSFVRWQLDLRPPKK